MSVSNPWLSTFQRSYNQIKNQLIENIKTKIPEITDFSEGNLFIILISTFSAIAEVLHYYIDNMARETFFITARRYSSLIKHSRMVDYHQKAAIPSTVDLALTTLTGLPSEGKVVINSETPFMSADGIQFLSTKTVIWEAGLLGVTVPVSQKVRKDNINFGNITSQDIIILIDDNDGLYVEGSLSLTINNELWELVDTFAYSGPTSKHYIVAMDNTQKPYIHFGDGVYGKKPPLNATIKGSYYVTQGADGNLEADSITVIPVASLKAKVTNHNPSSGGYGYEDFDMLKTRVPLSIRSLGVAITQQDYEDVTLLAPGVGKAYIDYICGRFVNIYITPVGGGIASQALLESTLNHISKRKVITTHINVLQTGISEIHIIANVTGKKSAKTSDITYQVTNALMDRYSYQNSGINDPIRLSDLYALIDNLSMVDFLKITDLYLKPWARPLTEGLTTELVIKNFSIQNIEEPTEYQIVFVNPNSMQVLNNQGALLKTITVGAGPSSISNNNDVFSIGFDSPPSGAYTNGDKWVITLLPKNEDQETPDFTIPIFANASDISLNITEVV